MISMVSVIMPVYNVEKYVGESIRSVLDQTYADWELIVINDGSTDNTANVVRSFTDPRIRLINQANEGVSAARNHGIQEARGDYIAFLDGDDLWHNDFLVLMVGKAVESSVPVVYCGYSTTGRDGREETYGGPCLRGDILYEYWRDGKVKIVMGAMLVNRNFLLGSGILFTAGCAISEDVEFIAKILCLTPAEVVPASLLYYRRRPGSATNSPWGIKNVDAAAVTARVREFVAKHYVGDDRDIMLEKLHSDLRYRRYKTVLAAVRHRQFELARKLFDEYDLRSVSLSGETRKIGNLIKLALLKTKSETIWRAFAGEASVRAALQKHFR